MNITQEFNTLKTPFKYKESEDTERIKNLEIQKRIITSEIYKKLYDSGQFDKENIRKIYDLLKDNLYG